MAFIRVIDANSHGATPLEEEVVVLGAGGKFVTFTTTHSDQGDVSVLGVDNTLVSTRTGAVEIRYETEETDDVVFVQCAAGMEFIYNQPADCVFTIESDLDLTFHINEGEHYSDYNISNNNGTTRVAYPYALFSAPSVGEGIAWLYVDPSDSNNIGVLDFFNPRWKGAMIIVHVAKKADSPSATEEL